MSVHSVCVCVCVCVQSVCVCVGELVKEEIELRYLAGGRGRCCYGNWRERGN